MVQLVCLAKCALDLYPASRCLDIGAVDRQASALAGQHDKSGRATYLPPLYKLMITRLNKAISATALLWREDEEAARLSTRVAPRMWHLGDGVLQRLDLVGQLHGHADACNAAKYTRAQIREVSDELEAAVWCGPALPHPAPGTEFAKKLKN